MQSRREFILGLGLSHNAETEQNYPGNQWLF